MHMLKELNQLLQRKQKQHQRKPLLPQKIRKKSAQVSVILKRRVAEDPTSVEAKIESIPYHDEEALMNLKNKKEKAKIKKRLKELSDRRGRIAISMEESAKLENALETAWKKADAIKKLYPNKIRLATLSVENCR